MSKKFLRISIILVGGKFIKNFKAMGDPCTSNFPSQALE